MSRVPPADATSPAPPSLVVIGCGALGRELVALLGDVPGVVVTCLAASLHNRPERIPDAVLRRLAEVQFRRREEAIDNVVMAAQPVIDEFAAARGADHEERRCLALIEPRGKLDIDFRTVIEGAERPPGRIIARDLVAETERGEIDTACDCRCRLRPRVRLRASRVSRLQPAARRGLAVRRRGGHPL